MFDAHDGPERLVLISRLLALDFEFDQLPVAGGSGSDPIRGYAPGSVVEVAGGSTASVTLLFSATTDGDTISASTKALLALASATGLEFVEWLGRQMRTRGRQRPWTVSRRFARRRVSAHYLEADAMLLTIEGRA
jgi:hypothetical protein